MITQIFNVFIDIASFLISMIAAVLPPADVNFDASIIQLVRGDRLGQLLFRMLDVGLILKAIISILGLRAIWWSANFIIKVVRG